MGATHIESFMDFFLRFPNVSLVLVLNCAGTTALLIVSSLSG